MVALLDPVPWKACWQACMMGFWCWAFLCLRLESATLAFNTTWFGAAFLFFAVAGDAAMPWLLPEKTPVPCLCQCRPRFWDSVHYQQCASDCVTGERRVRATQLTRWDFHCCQRCQDVNSWLISRCCRESGTTKSKARPCSSEE